MKLQIGKGRATTAPPRTTWSWPCPSSVSSRFQDVPLMLTSGSAHPPPRKLRLRDSYGMAWQGWRDWGGGARISTFCTFSLPRQPLHWTPCCLPLGSWCQAGCQVMWGGGGERGGAFPRGHSSSLPIFQFCQGRRKSQGWRPWGPTSC